MYELPFVIFWKMMFFYFAMYYVLGKSIKGLGEWGWRERYEQ